MKALKYKVGDILALPNSKHYWMVLDTSPYLYTILSLFHDPAQSQNADMAFIDNFLILVSDILREET